jgi:hypothetical protein
LAGAGRACRRWLLLVMDILQPAVGALNTCMCKVALINMVYI